MPEAPDHRDDPDEMMVPREVHSFVAHRYFVLSNGSFNPHRNALVIHGKSTQELPSTNAPTEGQIAKIRSIASSVRQLGSVIPHNLLYSALDSFRFKPHGYHYFLDEVDPFTGYLRRFTVVKDNKEREGYRVKFEHITLPWR